MGAVYRATDTKLNRDVAIKILPEAFAADPDRLARFTREAQVLASLNHPNIAAIYGVEERALILELVEGETLHGPLPVATALDYARQIAGALEYAHERGVVHRDLKPANVKVTPEGVVKLLDFGLAKALAGEPSPGDTASSPTLTMRATVAGVIMGTAAYMSPEQAHGRDADRRADIWSFGVVLYEMLTGRMAFTGESISDTLASVLKFEPDWNALPPETPAHIRKLLRQCLKKDRRQRLQAIGDARIALEESDTEPAPQAPPAPRPRAPWAIVAAVLAMISIALSAALWRATRPEDRPLMQFSVDLGPDALAGFLTPPAISPDGTRLVFASQRMRQLSVRQLNQPNATPLPGTDNAAYPFFSPDGQWIGFFANGKLNKIPVTGGAVIPLCAATTGRGATWGEDGTIMVAIGGSDLFRIPDSGGTLQPLPAPTDRRARSHRFPQILPGGQAVLFTTGVGTLSFEDGQIDILSLKTGKWKTVQSGGYFGRYLPTGHLLYVHNGSLFGVRFDLARLETRGAPAPLLEKVAANTATGGAQLDWSSGPSGHGMLVYFGGKSSGTDRTISWVDRAGKVDPFLATPGDYLDPHLSPDGKSLAFSGPGRDIMVYDSIRQNTTKLTFNGSNREPLWTPDGKHLVYDSTGDVKAIWWIRADGAGEPQKLLEDKGLLLVYSISPDGRRVAYTLTGGSGSWDIWTLPLDTTDPEHPKPGKPELLLGTPALEQSPAFSPDGRWIAYEPNESGRSELYVRPFGAQSPAAGGKWLISAGEGVRSHVWTHAGRELLYGTLAGRIMAAGYSVRSDAFLPEKPRPWPGPSLDTGDFTTFDISPDGKRLVMFTYPESADDNRGVHVHVLLNFFDEVRRKLP